MSDIHLISDNAYCPHCNDKFPLRPALYLLDMYAWIYCSNCQGRITKERLGKYIAVIKDVKDE